MHLEAKFKWVAGPPRSEEEGDQRLLIEKNCIYPEVATFRGGRWRVSGEDFGEIAFHSPFLLPKTTSHSFKVPS